MEEQATEHPVASVRAVLTDRVLDLGLRLQESSVASPHHRLAADDIRRWHARTTPPRPRPALPPVPAGSPIGGGAAPR